MKKIFKFIFILIFAFILWNVCDSSQANSISKISMDIFIEDNGDAKVTEVWTCSNNSGTEVYHPYYNLGNSTIKDLSVKEGSKIYTTLSSWDTSRSFDYKAYKCGINKISNGVELCWGISNYGSHTYTVTYTITNFVSQLTDSQMAYWTLIPYDFSNSIGSVYIKIHANNRFDDDFGVWGYGNYGGTAYVYDGYIEMQSRGVLGSSEYMTILVQFPDNTFNTNNYLNHDFNYYLDMAEEGSTKYTENKVSNIFVVIFSMLFTFLPFIIMISIFIYSLRCSNYTSKIDFSVSGGKYIPRNVDYYRDIPCNGDIFRAYYIAKVYGILKNETDILGAIILKWVKDDIIKLEQKDNNSIFKKEDTIIILNTTTASQYKFSYIEQRLYDMLKIASKDGILENKEFEKWCSSSYSTILGWFKDIDKKEKKTLTDDGYFTTATKKTIFGRKLTKYIATSKLRDEAIQIAGLKRYLLDYSLISEREPIEVKLFEEYLIYAQMMGIAKKVAKDFKDLYPDVIEASKFTSYDYIIFVNTYSARGISKANSAKSAAEARASSYSSGGGGFSSGGGGGGSFGGGGGGRWFSLKIIYVLNQNF